MELTNSAIEKFFKEGTLLNLSDSELKSLPKSFLIYYAKRHIHTVFHRLSDEQKRDAEISGFLRCLVHSRDIWGSTTVIDGPPPYKNMCFLCVNK